MRNYGLTAVIFLLVTWIVFSTNQVKLGMLAVAWDNAAPRTASLVLGTGGTKWDWGTVIVGDTPSVGTQTVTLTLTSGTHAITVSSSGTWLGLTGMELERTVSYAQIANLNLATSDSVMLVTSSSATTETITEEIPTTFYGQSNVITQYGDIAGTITFDVTYTS